MRDFNKITNDFCRKAFIQANKWPNKLINNTTTIKRVFRLSITCILLIHFLPYYIAENIWTPQTDHKRKSTLSVSVWHIPIPLFVPVCLQCCGNLKGKIANFLLKQENFLHYVNSNQGYLNFVQCYYQSCSWFFNFQESPKDVYIYRHL